MTEHLPECLVPDFDKGLWICICNQLRACEQRVRSQVVAALVNAQVDYFRLVVKHYPNITVAYEMLIDRAQGDQ